MKNIIVMLGLFLITSCSTGSKSVLGDEDRWDRRDRRERDDRRDRRDDWDDDDNDGIHVDL